MADPKAPPAGAPPSSAGDLETLPDLEFDDAFWAESEQPTVRAVPSGSRPVAPSVPLVAPRPPPRPVSPGAAWPSMPALAPVPAAEPFTQMREYRIVRPLGRGGMANVYLGQRPDGRLAAIKLLLPQYAQDPEIVRRFLLEMKATASLRHERVVEILDFGDWQGNYYLATEFMDGGSLRDLVVASHGRISPPVAMALVTMLLEGLGAAHRQQLVHRDVKPANVLLRSDGSTKLSDFGIARALDLQGLTKTGLLMGTPAYMSPEQAAGHRVDARSDLFSAGIVLYELVTGFNPFAGATETASLTKVLAADVPMPFEVNPALPAYLEPLLAKLLAKDPAARVQSADEAIAELARALPEAVSHSRNFVREALADPAGTYTRWAEDEARLRAARAEMLLQSGPARRPLAILELYRAHLLAPAATPAERRLRELFGGRDPFAAPQNPKLAELEAELARSPTSHALLMQLAALYKLELALVKSIGCYKRALRLRPDDGFAAGQLRSLIGEEADESLAAGHLTLKTMPGPRPPPPAPPTSPTGSPVPTAARPFAPAFAGPPVYVAAPKSGLARLAPTIVGVAVVLAVIFGVVRAAGRFVRATQEDMDHATTQLRAGIQASNSGAEPNPQDEINRRATALQQAAERDFVAAAARAKAGDPQAIDALEAFRTNHPKSPHRQDATFLLGQAQVAAGRFADARFELDAFLLAAPSDPRAGQAQLLRASVDEAAGAFDEALRHLQAVSASSSDPALLTEAFARQAQVYERKGDVPTAISRWREVQTRTAATEPLHVKAQEALDRLVGH